METDLLIKVLYVILMMESVVSSVLTFEYLCQDSLWLAIYGVTLDVHSSSMNTVELIVFNSRRSLSLRCCWHIYPSLSNWWPVDFHYSWNTWNNVLGLITTRLDHKTLVLHVFIAYAICINRLPSVLNCIIIRPVSIFSICRLSSALFLLVN